MDEPPDIEIYELTEEQVLRMFSMPPMPLDEMLNEARRWTKRGIIGRNDNVIHVNFRYENPQTHLD